MSLQVYRLYTKISKYPTGPICGALKVKPRKVYIDIVFVATE
jgi:hypothetical protein